ncbi:MAG: rhamnulokinase [Muribaculaceae bacterium]|nr:rhamnulokinase [Muribaculaceae bacterium]
MKTTYHLAVDLGATSGRTILAGFNGEKVEMEEMTRFKYPMLPIAGHLFWNLPFLYQEILKALKLTGEKLGKEKLASIGIDTWGCDVAYFYKDGTLAGLPYCYRDSHTEGAIERFSFRMSKDELYERTGIQFMDFNTVFQLFTIKENNPELIEAADKILFIPDALSYMLTGKAVMEYTVASTSQILNPKTGDLDEKVLEILGISRDKFGTSVKPGEIIGLLTQEVQDYTGLSGVPVVAVAGHDTASAVIAVPTPDEDYAYLSCGTWSLLGIESPGAIINEKSREYNFTNEGGVDGTTRFLKNICGLWIFERCREEFPAKFKDVPENISDLAALCEQSECDSIINPDHSLFAHPSSMMKSIDTYCEDTGQKEPQTPADYIRVIFRSLAKRYKEVLDGLKECSPKDVKRLHVIGGGSLNQYIMQYAADELGITVVAGPTESTALGNVLVQLQASGKVRDLAEMRKVAIASTSTKTYNPKKVVSC